TLRYLARVQSMLEAYEQAEQTLVEASQASHQLNDLGEYVAVLYERVLLGKLRQQFDDALQFGYECLDNSRKKGSLRWEALIKTQLGLLHQVKEDSQKAAVLLSEGLQIFRELGDLYEQAYSYYYLYKLYAEMSELEKSQSAKEQALVINQQLHDPQLKERLK
ncbi:MAG: hypothetical protein AAF614_01660, partial [Chloroflexota bacterium]